MNVFVYDQTLEGFLTAVFEAFRLKIFPDLFIGPHEAPPLLAERVMEIETDETKAERVWAGFKKKLSALALRQFMKVWFSEEAEAHALMVRYIRKIYQGRGETEFTDPDILAMRQKAHTVGHERERLVQFVRFQKTADGIYFAGVRPLYNVLPLAAGFFRDRFGDQKWLIFDLVRGWGLYYDLKTLSQTRQAPPADPETGRLPDELLDPQETLYQQAWTKYFESIAITERANPRLQAQFMPKRFWPLLTEKQPKKG